MVPAGESPPQLRGQLLGAQPWGIAKDEIEATVGEDVRELHSIVEPGELALPSERALQGAHPSQLLAQLRQPLAAAAVHAPPAAEQIGCPRQPQALRDGLAQAGLGARQRSRRNVDFGLGEPAEQHPLGGTGGGDDGPPQLGQLCRSIPFGRRPEAMAHRIEEAVALANEAVEVRQRQDVLGPLGPILRDHREPESQLGEPHRGPVAVYAEEVAPEDAAPRLDQGTPGAAGSREPVQNPQQERTGADGGIEHANRAQQAENRPVSVGQASLRFRVAAALSSCNQGREAFGQQALHQRGRGVVGARCAPLIRRHHALEHAPQHVRGDAAPIGLIDGEVEPLEQPVERVSPERIGNVAAEAPLERVRFEQPAVEEGNRAEPGGDARLALPPGD